MCVALFEAFICLGFPRHFHVSVTHITYYCQLAHHMSLWQHGTGLCGLTYSFKTHLLSALNLPGTSLIFIQYCDIAIDIMSDGADTTAYDEAYRWYGIPHKVSLIAELIDSRIRGDIVAVKVDCNKVFYIHEELLLQRSGFFRRKRRLSLGPAIRRYGATNLHRDNFERYIKYIYTGQIPGKGIADATEGQGLLEFYDLAATLDDTAAMNAAVDAYLSLYSFSTDRDRKERLPGASDITMIYTNDWETLMRLVVDMYVWDSDDDDIDRVQDDEHTDFFVDLTKAFMQQVRALKGESTDFRAKEKAKCCDYHDHNDGAPCPSRKRKRGDSDKASQ